MPGMATTPLTDTDLATRSVFIPDVMDTLMAGWADTVVMDMAIVDSADTELLDTVRSLSSNAAMAAPAPDRDGW